MKISKYSPEKLLEQMVKLDPIEFIGICKILGIKLYTEDLKKKDVEDDAECGQFKAHMEIGVRGFDEIWGDLCDKVESLNRKRRRNLGELVYAATKKEKEK